MRAEGELAGTGRWSLEQQGEVTTARYRWEVATTRPWMNLLAPARPLFTWNSRGVMLQAGGLAGFLGVRLVGAEFTARAWPGTRRLGLAVLARRWCGWWVARQGRCGTAEVVQPSWLPWCPGANHE